MSYLRIFGLQFLKTITILKISTLEFVKKRKSLVKKLKLLNLETKLPCLGIARLEFEKDFCLC